MTNQNNTLILKSGNFYSKEDFILEEYVNDLPNYRGEDCSPLLEDYREEVEVIVDEEEARDWLRDFGSWSDEELKDHDENINRILWFAWSELTSEECDYFIFSH